MLSACLPLSLRPLAQRGRPRSLESDHWAGGHGCAWRRALEVALSACTGSATRTGRRDAPRASGLSARWTRAPAQAWSSLKHQAQAGRAVLGVGY